MATLLDQLQRESEDLCGHRGLLAGTDDQTFSMALPIKLRNYYDKIVIPATTMGSAMPTGLLLLSLFTFKLFVYILAICLQDREHIN